MSDAYPLGAYDYPIPVTPARLQVGITQNSKRNLAKCATIVLLYYYSITHSSVSPLQGRHVSPSLDRLPSLPLQAWLRGLD